MARIVTFSIRSEDEWVFSAIKAKGGSTSAHIVAACKAYVEGEGSMARPEWYIDGADYSHLPIEERQKLVQFGYKDDEVG